MRFLRRKRGSRRGDARVPRAAFTGASYGARFLGLTNAIHDAVGVPAYHLDELSPGQRAIVALDLAFSHFYADGLQEVYSSSTRIVTPLLPDAVRLVGATRYADVFERANAAARGIDPDDFDALDGALEPFARELYALEDAGDVVWEHMQRYVEANPDEFFLPDG